MPQHHTLEKPKVKAKIIALVLDGMNDSQIAAVVGSTRQAITAFKGRHKDEIEPKVEQAAALVIDKAITDKANRLAAKDFRWQLLEQVRLARAKGEQGEETGLIVKQYKALGSGPLAEIVTEYKLDAGWLAAALALEDSAADELGQRPKIGDGLNIDKAIINIYRSAPDLGV